MEQDFSYQFYKTTPEAWDAMYNSLLSAKKSIYWEVYIFVDDNIGARFVKLLAEKAKAGVEVKVIIDAFGSGDFTDESMKLLKDSGAEILKFNRLKFGWRIDKIFTRIFYRNHRKVLIVDGETVFLGGVNISAEFKSWDDVYLKIVGKTARPLLRGFAKSYISAGGERRKVRHLLHPKFQFMLPEWMQNIRYITHSPSPVKTPKIKQFYLKALKMAKVTFNLVTPYYIPDRQFIRAIALARKRGVKVNIFMPLRPDHQFMAYIAQAYFELSIKAGANIFLLPNMHHGKALSVDDKIGMVGSTNLIPRTFTHNEESAVTFTHEKMVAELNELFNGLKLQAEPLNIELHRNRGGWKRVREWLAKKMEYFV